MHIQNREPDRDVVRLRYIFLLLIIVFIIKWIFFDND